MGRESVSHIAENRLTIPVVSQEIRRILVRARVNQRRAIFKATRIFHGAVEKLSKVLVKTSEERFASRSRGHRTMYIPLTRFLDPSIPRSAVS